ncbi:NlpC/P60 family protein [Enterobacter sp. V87_3]|uniref:NlpC/P60 family protein n=1 Tax=Enterobacter sp. V87_3 TaxID=3044236 RepID=UPI00249F198F|nr:NlpC/P60 family protein [Enterobacter sp. V87_3]MDI3428371.1 NlpC/P60 family protein [Enterobacter sp. V87_3]
MGWKKDVAISHLRSHALGRSHHECATFTREAILAGGIRLDRTQNAKDYGASLLRAGFSEVLPGSTPLAGDVAVIQPYAGGNSSGHMTMYDGTQWISDFRQRSMYPGPGYRAAQPAFKIYRMK